MKKFAERTAEEKDAIAGAFLAFAAMMKEDYGVPKAVALKALALAFDVNASQRPVQSSGRTEAR